MTLKTRPENEAKRLRAYELYLTASLDGKRRSFRSIAQELGVTLSAIQYWRDNDQWEQRVRETLLSAGRSAEIASAAFKMAVRGILNKGLVKLEKIINEGKDQQAIAAIKEIANIAVRFQAIDLSTAPGTSILPEWKDDLVREREDTNTDVEKETE